MGIRYQARAFAPASVGNVGVGFDILGHALDAVGDAVVAIRSDDPGVSVAAISGVVENLPTVVESNTAGRAVQSMWDALEPGFGVTLSIEKGIPLGSGMGGSAASAVAAVVAANALLPRAARPCRIIPPRFGGRGGRKRQCPCRQCRGEPVRRTRLRVCRWRIRHALCQVARPGGSALRTGASGVRGTHTRCTAGAGREP